MLRREKLTARFACIGGVVGDEEFIGIAKQIDVVVFKIPEIQPGYTFEHGRQACVLVGHGVAEAVAGGVEIGKQAFDVALRRIAVGGRFNGSKDSGQVGVQALIGVGNSRDIGKQLAGVDEVAFGFDGVVFDVRGDDAVGQLGIVDAVVAALDVAGEILANEAVKQCAEHVLFEI